MPYTLGSLFAGIGGIDLGFERARFKTIWQVEIDSYCRKILAKNFPDAERFEDVRTVGIKTLKPVDVVSGGFPCQDISIAGRREGIGGGRSGLWSEMARIIRELRPSFALMENVAALLTPTIRDGWIEPSAIGRVLGDLAEIGYDAEWKVISASDVGAPHYRERVWIVAYPREKRIQRFFPQEVPKFEAFSWCKNVGRVEDLRGRLDIPEPLFRGARDGISNWMDRIGALGNAVVPQIPELIARRISELLDSQRTAA
jgi:DNA (cytosine-5)-methyltransferase 1